LKFNTAGAREIHKCTFDYSILRFRPWLCCTCENTIAHKVAEDVPINNCDVEAPKIAEDVARFL